MILNGPGKISIMVGGQVVGFAESAQQDHHRQRGAADLRRLSYPDKRDCGVSQRAKGKIYRGTSDEGAPLLFEHELNELNELGTMRKSMRRADAKLDAARKYVSSYTSKQSEDAKQTKTVQVTPQTIKPQERPKGAKVESSEIKKIEKGYFFVVVTCNGKKHEIEKRFKSKTKAQEWISKHEYIEL